MSSNRPTDALHLPEECSLTTEEHVLFLLSHPVLRRGLLLPVGEYAYELGRGTFDKKREMKKSLKWFRTKNGRVQTSMFFSLPALYVSYLFITRKPSLDLSISQVLAQIGDIQVESYSYYS